MVGHEGVTLVTHTVPALVDLAQTALLLAAVLADCLTAPLAVVLENDAHAPKRLTAEHAEAGIKLENGLHVEDLREVVDRTGTFILQEDAVHFEGAGLFPAGGARIAVLTLVVLVRIARGRHVLELDLLFILSPILILFVMLSKVAKLVVVRARVHVPVPVGVGNRALSSMIGLIHVNLLLLNDPVDVLTTHFSSSLLFVK